MKVIKRVVIDVATNQVESEDSYEYDGPIAHCGNGGGNGGGSEGGYANDGTFGLGDSQGGWSDSAEGAAGTTPGSSESYGDSLGSIAGTGVGEGETGLTANTGITLGFNFNDAIQGATAGTALGLPGALAAGLLGGLLGGSSIGAFGLNGTDAEGNDLAGPAEGPGQGYNLGSMGSTSLDVGKSEQVLVDKKANPTDVGTKNTVKPPSFFELAEEESVAGKVTAADVRKRIGRLSMFFARPEKIKSPYMYLPTLTSLKD